MWCWFQGNYIKIESAKVSALSRVTKYADGCFETLRAKQGKIDALQQHVHRLEQGMSYLTMSEHGRLSLHEIQSIFRELLYRNHLEKHVARLRIQVWREGGESYSTKRTTGPVYMLTAQLSAQTQAPSQCIIAQIPRIPSTIIPSAFKFSSSLNYMLAQQEADAAGLDEALMLTVQRHVAETSMANVFWIKDKVFYTPDICCDILPGVTRANVIHFLQTEGCVVEQGCFTSDDLLTADAVFTTNAMRGIRPVQAIHHHQFDVQAVTPWSEAFEEFLWKE